MRKRIFFYKVTRDTIVIIVACLLIVSGAVYYSRTSVSALADDRTPQNTVLSYEDVTVHTSDDVDLKGWFIPAKAYAGQPLPTVIGLPGFELRKSHMLDWTYYLADTYNLFLVDLRGQGESGGRNTFGRLETRDVAAVLAYLKTRPDADSGRVAVYGYDLGAVVAIRSAEQYPEIKAVIADSAFDRYDSVISRWFERYSIARQPLTWLADAWSIVFRQTSPAAVNPAASIRNVEAPVLLVAAEQDADGAYDSLQRIRAQGNPDTVSVWTVPGNYATLFNSHRDEYKTRVREFLDSHL